MRKNPFLIDGYLDGKVSLNSIVLNNEILSDYNGKRMHEIISPKYLANLIRENIEKLKIDDIKDNRDLIIEFQNCLLSKTEIVKTEAENLVKKYSESLEVLIEILKHGKNYRGLKENWETKHWDYLAELKNIIFAGGICSGKKGERIRDYLINFPMIKDFYNISFFKNSKLLPRLGVARLASKTCKNSIVLDFGHSFIKRAFAEYKDGKLMKLEDLGSFYSKYVEEDLEKIKERAEHLFDYIIDVIKKTKQEIEKKGVKTCDQVLISIANYIKKGEVSPRGGYAKLAVFGEKLDDMIKEKLKEIFSRDYKVKIVHDGTAAALFFNELKDTAVITLGTGIGIGFTELDYELCDFDSKLMEFL